MKPLRLIIALVTLACACLAGATQWKLYSTTYYDPRTPSITQPQDIVSSRDGGAYLLCDYSITKFDSSGNVQWTTPYFTGVGRWDDMIFNPSHATLVEGTNGFYVIGLMDFRAPSARVTTTEMKYAVVRYDLQGRYQCYASVLPAPPPPSSNVAYPMPFCTVDGQDNLYVGASGICKLDSRCNIVWNGFSGYSDLQMAPSGNLIASGHSVSEITPSGVLLWSVPAPCQFDYSACTVGPDGSVYAAYHVAQQGTMFAEKINPNGSLAWSAAESSDNYGPVQVTLTSNGVLEALVGSHYSSFSPSGSLLGTAAAAGIQMAADGSGNLYFLNAYTTTNPTETHWQVVEYNSANVNVATWTVPQPDGETTIAKLSGQSVFLYAFTGSGMFGPSTYFSADKYDLAGNPHWVSPQTTSTWTSVVWHVEDTNPSTPPLHGAVSSNGTTYIASTANAGNGQVFFSNVTAIDTNGKIIYSTWAPIGIERSLVLEPDGSCMAFGDSAIAKIGPTGVLQWTAPGGVDHVLGYAFGFVDSSGNVVGCLPNDNGAFKLSPTGQLLWKYPSIHGSAALDPQGNLYVAQDVLPSSSPVTITKILSSGAIAYTKSWNLSEDQVGGLQYVDASGNLYFGGSKYTPDGVLLWSGGGGRIVSPDNNGNLWEAGTESYYVQSQVAYDLMALKVNATTGDVLWKTPFRPGIDSDGNCGIPDGQGNLILRGYCTSSFDPSNTYALVPVSTNDVTLLVGPNGGSTYSGVFDTGFNVSEAFGGAGCDKNGFYYSYGAGLGPDGTYELYVNKYGPPLQLDSTITQTSQPTMVCGVNYSVQVRATNTGTNTWTAASGYKLDCLEPSVWNCAGANLSGTDSILNGQTKTFNAIVKAPATPGTYLLAWKMEQSGTQFGTLSPAASIKVVAQTNFASFVGQSVPTSMVCGETYPVSLQFQNTGSNTWTTVGGYDLVSVNPGLNMNWGRNHLALANGQIGPGQTATYSANLIAPSSPGTYNFEWQPNQEGMSPYGPFSPNVVVTVTKLGDAARLLSAPAAPFSVPAGQTFGFTVAFMNVGTNTWTSGGSYGLKSRNPYNNTNWGTNFIPVVADTYPGGKYYFSTTLIADTTPGVHYLQFSMIDMKTGTLFGDLPPPVSVTVTPTPNWSIYVTTNSQPPTINAGTDFYVQYTMSNAGTNGWSNGTGYSMMSLNPANNVTWNRSRLYLPGTGTVSPGSNVTITGLCMAPVVPGTYTMQWQMDVNGSAFGQPTPLTSITVTQGPDDARYVSQSGVPTSIVHSTAFTATINMKNLGTATWDSSYALVPVGTSPFGITSIPVPSTASGATAAITAKFTAPGTAGAYHFQFRMSHNGVKFGQASADVVVTVT